MDNKILTFVLVVIIGVLVGLTIVTHRSQNPMLSTILEQQNEILTHQKDLGSGTAGFGANVNGLTERMNNLENRLSSLETVLKQLAEAKPEKPSGPPPEDYAKEYDIPVAHSPIRGPKDAPITIVEFVDFECPFCARFHPPIKQVLEAYPEQVNYMVKNMPLSFHPNARSAAKAAFAAGEQGKYFEMADLLLENGRNLNQATYEKLAKDLDLNVKKFKKDLEENDAKYDAYITEDMNLAQKVNVRGTPTFFIDGKKTTARDFPRYKAEIEKLLAE